MATSPGRGCDDRLMVNDNSSVPRLSCKEVLVAVPEYRSIVVWSKRDEKIVLLSHLSDRARHFWCTLDHLYIYPDLGVDLLLNVQI